MNATQSIALERAVALLYAAGARFAILTADGRRLGELKVATEPDVCLDAPRRRKKDRYIHLFREKMDAMKQADVLVLPVPDSDKIGAFQSCVCSYAYYKWGKGSVVTSRRPNGKEVEVLRVL